MALQHGLEAVNALQSQIDNIAKLLKPGDPSKATEFAPTPEASESIENLKKAHSVLSNEIEALYGSLNIPSSLPQLRDYPPEFVSLLVITRDMKMALRDRVIQSFHEWDRLDQAAGGVHQPLGMSLLFLVFYYINRFNTPLRY